MGRIRSVAEKEPTSDLRWVIYHRHRPQMAHMLTRQTKEMTSQLLCIPLWKEERDERDSLLSFRPAVTNMRPLGSYREGPCVICDIIAKKNEIFND